MTDEPIAARLREEHPASMTPSQRLVYGSPETAATETAPLLAQSAPVKGGE